MESMQVGSANGKVASIMMKIVVVSENGNWIVIEIARTNVEGVQKHVAPASHGIALTKSKILTRRE